MSSFFFKNLLFRCLAVLPFVGAFGWWVWVQWNARYWAWSEASPMTAEWAWSVFNRIGFPSIGDLVVKIDIAMIWLMMAALLTSLLLLVYRSWFRHQWLIGAPYTPSESSPMMGHFPVAPSFSGPASPPTPSPMSSPPEEITLDRLIEGSEIVGVERTRVILRPKSHHPANS